MFFDLARHGMFHEDSEVNELHVEPKQPIHREGAEMRRLGYKEPVPITADGGTIHSAERQRSLMATTMSFGALIFRAPRQLALPPIYV
jgi:hypothetical protein